METVDIMLPTHVQDAIARGQNAFSQRQRFDTNYPNQVLRVRIPTKPAMHSNMKPATRSDLKPAMVPI
jgi:hypothetical protein